MSLYGLKQPSRQLFQKFNTTLLYIGFQQSKGDYSFFINKSYTHITIVAIHIDDILVTVSYHFQDDFLKAKLNALLGIKDFGHLHY